MQKLDLNSPIELFTTKQGQAYVLGALRLVRAEARHTMDMVRGPELRNQIPLHIQDDIVSQACTLLEFVGRAEAIFTFFKKGPKQGFDYDQLVKIFIQIYTAMCSRRESLDKLCKLTSDTYRPRETYSADWTKL